MHRQDLPQRLHQVLAPWLAHRPDSVALEEDERQVTCGELAALAESVAARLAAVGLRAGDRLLLVADNRIALVAWLQENLAPYKIPARIELLEHLPATATGKILKSQLRQMAAAGVAAGAVA